MNRFLRQCGWLLQVVLSLGVPGCKVQPQSHIEERPITKEQRQEREELMVPISKELKTIQRDGRSVTIAPSLEGKPVKAFQRLLALADLVRHDPANQRTQYIYVWASKPEAFVNHEDGSYPSFIIHVYNGTIEQAVRPPMPEF